jgi:AbrB family looped-hinge helix DNA binding protein
MLKLRLKVGPKGQIIIPKILREKYGIRENDYVFIEIRDDELVKLELQALMKLWSG